MQENKASIYCFLERKRKEMKVLLYPMPAPTRWNSWLNTVEWLAEYLDLLIEFVNTAAGKKSGVNRGVNYFLQLSASKLNELKTQVLFVKGVGSSLKPFLVLLETTNRPLAHEMYPKLYNLKTKLKILSECIFEDEVNTALSLLSTSSCTKTSQILQSTAMKALQKLATLMDKDLAGPFLNAVSKLFGKKSLLTMEFNENTVQPLQQHIPSLLNVPINKIIHGCLELKVQLQENVNTGIVEQLFSIKEELAQFTDGALRAIWIPVNNEDPERFFSVFTGVLTSMRTNLSVTNLDIMASMAYESAS